MLFKYGLAPFDVDIKLMAKLWFAHTLDQPYGSYEWGMPVKQRKSTRETKNMIQTALWLPRGMHAQLKKAGGERGLGDEIRQLLEASMAAAETPIDEITDEVLDQIRDVARDLSVDRPLWADRLAYDAFKAAVNALLSSHEPSSEAPAQTKAKFQAIYGDENPETVGRIMARRAEIAYARERGGQAFLDKLKGLQSSTRGRVSPKGGPVSDRSK
jgi:hypothetical protein